MNRTVRTKKQKGFVILTGGIMMLFVVPVIGLAIDAGFLYAVKSRLQAAADAASLAAARSLSVGLTLSEQEASARARADAFFQANYPPGIFNTTSRTLQIDITEEPLIRRIVTITASVDSPLFFMRMLRSNPTSTISVRAVAARRDVNVMMVMDRSGSMNTNGGCLAMRNAANGFVNLFANQRDRIGMITYGVAYALTYPSNINFKSSSPTLPSVINTISCNGGTGTAQAFWKGYEQLVNINEPGRLNVVLLFTDGIPNTVTANFPVNVLDTGRVADGAGQPNGPNNSRCYDFENSQNWRHPTTAGVQNPNWRPNNQVYRGAIYSQENIGNDSIFGVMGYTTTTFTDPGVVTRPLPNVHSADSAQYTTGPSNHCWFQGGSGHTGSSAGTGTNYVQYDIAYYPLQDLYGTNLAGAGSFRSINLRAYPPGVTGAPSYIDIRDRYNLMKASINAVDNVGKRVRNNDLNPNINTIVYAVGLGEVGEDQHTLLRRVSNDPDSPIYDPTKPSGMYVYAPNATDLNSAFIKIASEILRFAH